jgi:hypothetical protein
MIKKCSYEEVRSTRQSEKGVTCDALGVPMSHPAGHLCFRSCGDRRRREDRGKGSERKEDDRSGAPHRPRRRHGLAATPNNQPGEEIQPAARCWEVREREMRRSFSGEMISGEWKRR